MTRSVAESLDSLHQVSHYGCMGGLLAGERPNYIRAGMLTPPGPPVGVNGMQTSRWRPGRTVVLPAFVYELQM